MKKMIKIMIAASLVLILAGTGITAASFAMGADPVRIGRYLEDRLGVFDAEILVVTPESERTAAVEQTHSAERSELYAGSTEVCREDIYENYESSWSTDGEVTEIEIRLAGGTVDYIPEEDCAFEILWNSGTPEHVRYDEGSKHRKVTLWALDGEEYRIRVPSEWQLQEIEIDADSGVFSGEMLRAEEIDVYAGGPAEICFSQTGGKVTSIECDGAGVVRWTSEDELPECVDAECTGVDGSILLAMPDAFDPEEAGYEMKWENGEIIFPERTLSGKGSEQKQEGPGKPYLELKAEHGGTITVVRKR